MSSTKYQVVARFKESAFHIRGEKVGTQFRKVEASQLSQAQMAQLHKGGHPGIEQKAAAGKQG